MNRVTRIGCASLQSWQPSNPARYRLVWNTGARTVTRGRYGDLADPAREKNESAPHLRHAICLAFDDLVIVVIAVTLEHAAEALKRPRCTAHRLKTGNVLAQHELRRVCGDEPRKMI